MECAHDKLCIIGEEAIANCFSALLENSIGRVDEPQNKITNYVVFNFIYFQIFLSRSQNEAISNSETPLSNTCREEL
jgi:hypothetical protein